MVFEYSYVMYLNAGISCRRCDVFVLSMLLLKHTPCYCILSPALYAGDAAKNVAVSVGAALVSFACHGRGRPQGSPPQEMRGRGARGASWGKLHCFFVFAFPRRVARGLTRTP